MKNKNLGGTLFAASPKPLQIRETALSATIAGYLDSRRIYHDRLQSGAIKMPDGSWIRMCKSGTPDRFAIIRGQIVFIEVKQAGEKPSEVQTARHLELIEAEAIVIVADNFCEFVNQFSAYRELIETRHQKLLNLEKENF